MQGGRFMLVAVLLIGAADSLPSYADSAYLPQASGHVRLRGVAPTDDPAYILQAPSNARPRRAVAAAPPVAAAKKAFIVPVVVGRPDDTAPLPNPDMAPAVVPYAHGIIPAVPDLGGGVLLTISSTANEPTLPNVGRGAVNQ